MRRSLLDTDALVAAVIADPDALDALAAALAPRLRTGQVEEFLTTDEAADLLRCQPQRIRRLHHEGRLRGVKDGGRLLIPRSAIDTHLSEENE